MKNPKFGLRALALLLSLCMVLTACGGGGEDPTTQAKPTVPTTEDPETTYSVCVQNNTGKPLEGVGVWVYTDSSKSEMIWFDKTNAEGKMSFVALTSDSYVVSLQNVPDGYEVADYYALTGENTMIELPIELVEGSELDNVNLKLGDVMIDFSVTATDGTVYDLSDILATKKAVVLNFFYNECDPCKKEFPYLQEAYTQYADEVLVLGMNPVNTNSDAVAALATQLGLTFPLAVCDNAWEKALNIGAYPTTVVVDRYGIISLIHTGSIPDAQTFADIFAFFARADYVQEVVPDIDQIVGTPAEGTEENPIELGSITEFMANVEAGGQLHYNIYKISGMTLEIRSQNAWVTYEGKTYYPENGVISIPVTSPDVNTPVKLVIGNSGSQAEVICGVLTYPAGTGGNPFTLELGDFTVNVAAGNDQGVWYTYKARQTGVLRLTCLQAPAGIEYMYTAYNLNTNQYKTSEGELQVDETTGLRYLAIAVNAGDQLQVTVGTLPDEEFNYPAATIQMNCAMEEPDQGEEPVVPPVPPAKTYTYSVTVVDEKGNALPNVTAIFYEGGDSCTVLTNASGVASYTGYTDSVEITLVVTPGYTALKTEFVLTQANPDIAVTYTAVMQEVTFTDLYVGKAYHVTVGDNEVKMDPENINYFMFYPEEAGVYRFSTSAASAVLSYWGSNEHYIVEATDSTDYADNTFTLNIKEGALGQGHILGITGAENCVLTITRISDPLLDESDAPWQTYEPVTAPSQFTLSLNDGESLSYVDITGNAADYNLVYNEATGYYHLNAVDGPVVYVNLKSAPYVALNTIVQTAAVRVYYYDDNGKFTHKVDFTQCVMDYAACADSATGVYPLNDDLMHIIKEFGGKTGWWNETSPNYLFQDVEGLNTQIAWMFMLCYVK